jgi:tRNA(fMet)-specific endonuclease VapC
VGIVLDSPLLIAAERAGQNPRKVIEDLFAQMGDTEATLSIITLVELAHGIERANSTVRKVARERFSQ